MVKVVDWEAGHSPLTGTMNAAYTAFAAAAMGHEVGLPGSVVIGTAVVGAAGAAIAGGSHEPRLSGGSIALRVGAWLAGGGWVSYALTQNTVYSWSVVGPMLATAAGFGSLVGALGAKRKRDQKRAEEAHNSLFRVKVGQEWEQRFERVCHVPDTQVLAVEQWKDDDGKDTGAGFDLDVQMPLGGSSWRTLAGFTNELAADARLPEGCGVSVFSGAGRDRAIVKVQMVNALIESRPIPHDASELSFLKDFDIGVTRDGDLAVINIREFSAILAGAKRTGKTNQLDAIISRLLRMRDLRVWVIDFNGGGVAQKWLQAWHALGRPGRPPIDWVASTLPEAAMMGEAAVRIAKARKIEYQQFMIEHDTDLLPLSGKIPGIVIITDEGAEVYADPKTTAVAKPMKEVLRIAGSSGVNQINCFLRATADTTGDTIIKSQSKVRIGMRMEDEQEISYLLGWKCGVTPEDMPDQGFGALSLDQTKSAAVFRGWRVLPSDARWFVENTVCYRQDEDLDEVSKRAAGPAYAERWSEARSGYLFGNSPVPAVSMVKDDDATAPTADADDFFGSRPPVDPEQARINLQKAIADAPKPEEPQQDEFDRVLGEAGVTDWSDPSKWPDGQPQIIEPPAAEEPDADLKDVVFGLVKAMSPKGISVGEIVTALEGQYGKENTPRRETITRWLREDDRYYKPTGYRLYAVKPEEM